jgi:hypothetical protein
MYKTASSSPLSVYRYFAAARHALASVKDTLDTARTSRPRAELLAARAPIEHLLDCAPEFFRLFVGERPATEIRHHHAVYRVGDRLRIRERMPGNARGVNGGAAYFTGRECVRVIVAVKPWNRRTGLVEITLDGGAPDA